VALQLAFSVIDFFVYIYLMFFFRRKYRYKSVRYQNHAGLYRSKSTTCCTS
jgi:hypothetical protein